LEVLSHDKTSLFEHPPIILRPPDVISSPDGEDLDDVIPDDARDISIELSRSDIPFPAPIFKVILPGPVPVDDKPDPAVMDVTACEDMLFESSNVPLLPERRLSSLVDINAPSKILISLAFAFICVPERYISCV